MVTFAEYLESCAVFSAFYFLELFHSQFSSKENKTKKTTDFMLKGPFLSDIHYFVWFPAVVSIFRAVV